ncbi:MAG: hypothetical protein HY731_13605, partial [Candidatus Tectomicrobia bacterium]|nr:hypothetical protein [Candidatus Tectomicrobia bacterium]
MATLDDYRVDLNYLTPDNAPCEGMRAVVAYLESQGAKAIGVGRATVTIEQLDLGKWPAQTGTSIERGKPPRGNCRNPLLLRFFDDPDVWTLSLDDLGPEPDGIFKAEDEPPGAEFIR